MVKLSNSINVICMTVVIALAGFVLCKHPGGDIGFYLVLSFSQILPFLLLFLVNVIVRNVSGSTVSWFMQSLIVICSIGFVLFTIRIYQGCFVGYCDLEDSLNYVLFPILELAVSVILIIFSTLVFMVYRVVLAVKSKSYLALENIPQLKGAEND